MTTAELGPHAHRASGPLPTKLQVFTALEVMFSEPSSIRDIPVLKCMYLFISNPALTGCPVLIWPSCQLGSASTRLPSILDQNYLVKKKWVYTKFSLSRFSRPRSRTAIYVTLTWIRLYNIGMIPQLQEDWIGSTQILLPLYIRD